MPYSIILFKMIVTLPGDHDSLNQTPMTEIHYRIIRKNMDGDCVATFLFRLFTKPSKISVQKELFLPNNYGFRYRFLMFLLNIRSPFLQLFLWDTPFACSGVSHLSNLITSNSPGYSLIFPVSNHSVYFQKLLLMQ